VEHLVQVFREVKRVLRPEGTVFIVLGDSYFSSLTSSQNKYKLIETLTWREIYEITLEIRKNMPEVWKSCWGNESEGSLSEMLSEEIQSRALKTSEKITKRILSQESSEIYGANQETVGSQKRGSDSEVGGQVCMLRRNGTDVSLLRPYQGRRPERLSKERRSTRSMETSHQGGIAEGQVSSFMLELQRSIGLIRFLYSLRLKISDIPESIKIYFEPESKLKPKDLCMIPARVAFALQSDGWWLRSDIIWAKPNPMPESVTDRPTKSHEHVFLLAKSGKYYYDFEAIKEKNANPNRTNYKPGKEAYSEGNVHAVDSRTRRNDGFQAYADGKICDGRNKRSVWTVATQPSPIKHYAIYPEKLIEPCIKAGCPEGGTVLDPFSGAGTTGVVATRNDRDYIGIELSDEYAPASKARIYNSNPLFTREIQ